MWNRESKVPVEYLYHYWKFLKLFFKNFHRVSREIVLIYIGITKNIENYKVQFN